MFRIFHDLSTILWKFHSIWSSGNEEIRIFQRMSGKSSIQFLSITLFIDNEHESVSFHNL